MEQQRLGQVSRRRLMHALLASGLTIRHNGGELVVVLPGRHVRIGGRRGVSPAAVARLSRQMTADGLTVQTFQQHLYGRRKGS